MKRGELWWARLPQPDKTRPVALVSRDGAYEVREFIVVASVTTRMRGTRAEVPVGMREGLDRSSVINCDVLSTVPKTVLLRRVGALDEARSAQLDESLMFALGLRR